MTDPTVGKKLAEMTVEEYMRETGMDRDDAREALAIERGESRGDVIIVDEPKPKKRRARK